MYEPKCFFSITSVIDFLILLLISSINRLENSMLKGWMSNVTRVARRGIRNIDKAFQFTNDRTYLIVDSIIRITHKRFNFFVLCFL